MKKRQLKKSVLALSLCGAMLLSDTGPLVEAWAEEQAEEEALAQTLLDASGQYPEGAFTIGEPQLTGTEGEKMELTILRQGARDQEARVSLKAVDVSALYGKDYILTVKEGAFLSQTLRKEDESGTLMDQYEAIGEEEAAELEEQKEQEEADALKEEADTGLKPEEEPTKEPEEEAKQEPETTPTEAPGTYENFADGAEYQVPEGKSSLQAARDIFLNQDSVKLNWRETEGTEAQAKRVEEMSQKSQEEMESLADLISGTGYTFTFAPGEYKKVVEIELLDDELSEGEEQVMFLLYQAQGAGPGDSNTGYLNIADNDEKEPQIFGVESTDVYVSEDEAYAEIRVNRTSGVEQFAAVYAATGGDTAIAGADYTETQKELVFSQGDTEETLRIPILPNEDRGEERVFYVGLEAKGGQIAEDQKVVAVHIVETPEEAVLAEEKSSGEESVSFDSGTKEVRGIKSSGSFNVTSRNSMDLTMADKVTLNLSSGGGRKWKEEVDCEDRWFSSEEGYLEVCIQEGFKILQIYRLPDKTKNMNNVTVEIPLEDKARGTNRHISICFGNLGKNDYTTVKVNSVKVSYPEYSYVINNDSVEDQNSYVEQWYGYAGNQAPGDAESKKRIKLGELKFASASNDAGNELRLRKTSSNVGFAPVQYSGEKNSLGVPVSGENAVLEGVRLVNGKKKSDVLKLSQITFTKDFLNKYKDYLHNNTFTMYPVFKVKETSVYLANTSTEGAQYSYTSGNAGQMISCKALDCVRVSAVAKGQDKAVSRIEAGVMDNLSIRGTLESQIKAGKGRDCVVNGKTYSWKDLTSTQRNAVMPEEMELTPQKDTFVYVQLEAPKVQVTAKKNGANLDKIPGKDEEGNEILTFPGSVIYIPEEGEGVAGDPETPMTILGAAKFQPLAISALTQEGYKTVWYERTGDTDGDGMLDDEEVKALEDSGYTPMTPVTGNILTFTPKLTETLLNYEFIQSEPEDLSPLRGTLFIRDTAFVTGETIPDKVLAGATVTANGIMVQTDENGKYDIEDLTMEPRDYVMVAVSYNGVSYNFIQNPEVSKRPKLDAYTGIKRVGGSLARKDGGSTAGVEVVSGDIDYVLTVSAAGENPAIQPTKAVLRFYKKDGSSYGQEIWAEQEETEQTKNSGTFKFTFNPSNINQGEGSPIILEPGSRVTVQFLDQNDVGYYEHETGITVLKGLGAISFLNSFKLTSGAASILGNINALFGMNWDGNMDSSDYVADTILKEAKTGAKYRAKLISVSERFEKAYDSEDGEEQPQENQIPAGSVTGTALAKEEARTGLETAQKELEEASEAYANETDPAKKEVLLLKADDKRKAVEAAATDLEAKETAYQNAVTSAEEKKSTKVTMAVNASVDLGFNLTIQLNYDNEEAQWYFASMMLAADVTGGADVKFVFATPIGLDVTITVGAGVDTSSVMLEVRQRGDEKLYISDWGTETDGIRKIDIFDSDMDNEDRQLDFYGEFVVKPKLTLAGDVGFSLLSTSVGLHATALFDLKYYANPDETHQNSQVLKLTGGLHIKILGLSKSWDYNMADIDLSGGKSASKALLSAMSDDTALYDSVDTFTAEDRSYLNERSGWNSGAVATREAVSGLQEMVLRKGNYTMPDVQMANLGGNKMLAVYLDVDTSRPVSENQMALYYTIYENETWCEPKLLENDGMLDDSPVISEMGDGRLMVAWSAADREFASGENLLTMLSARNIHTAIFDKEKQIFGEIQEATRTTEEDFCADVEPKISYYSDGDQQRMLMYYAKNEYEATDNAEGVVGDAIYPYSLMAYQFYDFENETWRHTYTEKEKQAIIESGMVTEESFAQYEENWYGQGFLNLPPAITVEESLDEDGYWTEEPTIIPPSSGQNEGLVVDTDVITYYGLAIFAYIFDKDGVRATSEDRDVYIQFYDYKDDIFMHPVIITSNKVEESSVKLSRSDQGTLLAYQSEGQISVLNLSSIVGLGAYIKGEAAGQEFYYLNKSKDGGYVPPYVIQSYADVTDATEKDQNTGRAISSFDIHTSADNSATYLLWTESAPMLKEGMDPHSPEAELAENQSTQTQIYGSRLQQGTWSGRTQVTEAEAIYGNVDFAVDDSGNLVVMASRNEAEDTASSTPRTGCDLVSFKAVPDSRPVLDNLEISDVAEGENGGRLSLRNEGFADAENLQLVVKDQAGTELLNESFEELYSGQSGVYSFTFQVPEGQKEWGVTAELKSGETVIDSISESGEIPVSLTLSNMELTQETERDSVTAEFEMMNSSGVTVAEQEVKISAAAEGEALATVSVPSLAPGEKVTLSTDLTITDDMFMAYTDSAEESAGDSVEKLTLYAMAETGEMTSASLERRTPAADMERIRSITGIILEDGKTVEVKTGEYESVSASVASELMKFDEFTTLTNYNLEILWSTADPEIAEVDANGMIRGLQAGKTTLTAVLKPKSPEIELEEKGNGREGNNMLTLTSDAFLTVSIEIDVQQGEPGNEITPTPEPTDTPDQGDSGSGSGGGSSGKPGSGDNADTGNDVQILVWILLLAAALAAGGGLIIYKKKKKEH